MQTMKNKKVWFFLLLGVMIMTTFCLWRSGMNETKAFANGRIVEKEHPEERFLVQTQSQIEHVESETA